VLPELDFPLAFAGMCRHEVDWLYGVNLSRALTQSALKASNRYSTLSTGRVQGPTLRFVVDREQEIETFVPLPYWALTARVDIDGKVIEAEYEFERLETKAQAEQAIRDCAGRNLNPKRTNCRPPLHVTSPHFKAKRTGILATLLEPRSASRNASTWTN
jgi:DNA topoisomerase-1